MDVFCIVNQTVKLAKPTPKTQLPQPLAYDNALAHSMRVTVLNEDESAADLTGVGVIASMMRADGETVTPIMGEVNGNVAEVVLPGACYAAPGRFKFTLNLFKATEVTASMPVFSASDAYAKGDVVAYEGVAYRFTAAHPAGEWTGEDVVTDGSARTALWVEGYVERNTTNDIVDPGNPPGNLEQIIGRAESAASAATSAAASANSAAADATAAASHAVCYDTAQSLTAAQKTQARTNIGAAGPLTFADDGTGNITIT